MSRLISPRSERIAVREVNAEATVQRYDEVEPAIWCVIRPNTGIRTMWDTVEMFNHKRDAEAFAALLRKAL